MKRLSIPLLACLASLSCGVDVFETSVTGDANIEGAPGPLKLLNSLGPLDGMTQFDVKQTEEFRNQDVEPSDVDSVKLSAFTLEIVSPGTQDFSFLKSIQFWAEANGQRALIAEKNDIDKLGLKAPNPVLVLDLKDVELKPYVTAPSMSITTQVTGSQPDNDTHLRAKVTFRVDVDVF